MEFVPLIMIQIPNNVAYAIHPAKTVQGNWLLIA
jgi:hypothetical protein